MKRSNTAQTQAHGRNLTDFPADGPEPRDGGGSAAQEGGKPEGARKIQQSIAYMMQHLNQPLQVAKLAQTAHISPSHFFVLFKRWAGASPIDYFIRLRMRRAGRLVATTTMSVKEIAAALGYDDRFYFSRVFKSVHGMAPSGYRLKMKELGQTDPREAAVGPENPY
jgi:transcriptional regulator GlxA family with amidase domain